MNHYDIVFLFLKIIFVLANIAGPKDMQQYESSPLFSNVPTKGFPVYNGLSDQHKVE